ncbi:hypothetical protein ACQQ2Q_10965 [Agrobacterium sp. ES01]|uniref:hypothetical protein n=1 Tax=Agrobacterium sp. ES01 TaxID=3420714 RepID=UPI003D0A541B
MNKFATATLLAVLAGSSAAYATQPIQGSITYNGNESYLPKSPVGSNFEHRFTGQDGQEYREIYRVNASHSVDLVTRQMLSNDQ